MNRYHPTVLDALARAHVLGTLGPAQTRRFAVMLARSAAARQAVAQWQERVATLALALPPQSPSPALRQRLQQQLFGEVAPASASAPPQALNPDDTRHVPAASVGRSATGQPWRPAPPPPWGQRLRAWLGQMAPPLALALGVGALSSVLLVQQQPGWVGLETARDTVPPAYIGVLTDAQDQPALLVGSRRQGHSVSLKLLQPVPAGRSARLWAVPANGAAPFVVGALPASGQAVLALPVPAEQLFAQVSRLVVTQQPVGEPPSATLQAAQVMWQGHCAKLW